MVMDNDQLDDAERDARVDDARTWLRRQREAREEHCARTGDHPPRSPAEQLMLDLLDEAQRLTAERDAARAIVEGRTTPPTDEEIEAHHAAGGSWLTGDTVTWAPASVRAIRDDGEADGCVWIALDADNRPTAWPVVTP